MTQADILISMVKEAKEYSENSRHLNTQQHYIDGYKKAVELMLIREKILRDALKFYSEGWHYRIADHEIEPSEGVECTFETGCNALRARPIVTGKH